MAELITSLVEIVIAPLMGYIALLLKRQKKDRDANSKGTMLLLRIQLIEYHEAYVIDKKPMPSYAWENICDMYDAYKKLDGNSMINKMFEELKEVNLAKKGK